MKYKTCFKCNIEKKITEFYIHPGMSDGYVNKCKECNKIDVQKNYFKNIDYYKEYEKSRRDNEDRLKSRKDYSRWLRKYYPEKVKEYQSRYDKKHRHANIIVGNAIRDKKLLKSPCIICGNIKSEGHHEDYNKPLDVIWLCRKHHMERHRK